MLKNLATICLKQMKIFLFIFLAFICGIIAAVASQGCPMNVYGTGSHFYILSDQQTDADTACSKCSKSGGILAEINEEAKRNHLFDLSVQRHIPPDLISIKIRSRDNDPYVNEYEPSIGSGVTVMDPVSISDVIPKPGRLNNFRLYKDDSNSKFTKVVNFCYYLDRDFIRTGCTNVGWNENFQLYGGTNQTESSILLYNYIYKAPHSTNLYLTDSVEGPKNLHLTEDDPTIIFIPDISVFVGGLSDVGEDSWKWSNGTIVEDEKYPPGNQSFCQQMTWPLTYRDGINLRPKKCDQKAYFICQAKFEIEVRQIQCNGSVLEVSWDCQLFETITAEDLEFEIELSIFDATTSITSTTISFCQSSLMFVDLHPQSKYMISGRVFQSNCDNVTVIASSTGTTSYGIPRQVTEARVLNETSTKCIIEWKHDNNDSNILRYSILGTSDNETFVVNVVDFQSTQTNDAFISQEVELLPYIKFSVFEFKIQAFSCEGGSLPAEVQGNCTVPPEPTTPFNTGYLIIPAAVVVVILLLLGGICYSKRRNKKNEKNQTNNLRKQSDILDPHPQTSGSDVGKAEYENFESSATQAEEHNVYVLPNPFQYASNAGNLPYENLQFSATDANQAHTYETI